MTNDASEIRHNVYELSTEPEPRFIEVKFNRIEDDDETNVKTLVQLVDVSHKMKVEDLKTEKKMLTVMNATVSHEIRNPLNALLGQIAFIASLLASFSSLLAILRDNASFAALFKPLQDICDSLGAQNKKMKSAANFIDFFVHDILDFTLLHEAQGSFTKIN